MKYAIIAAGEGSRLAHEGVGRPKPLVRVGGECLIDRLFRIFMQHGATEIVAICNEQMTDVREHLEQQSSLLPLRFVVKSTPSSMHSAWELSRWLHDEPFILTTVDTIFREEEFAAYVGAFQSALQRGEADGLMGVTDYIDDEKPLYVDVGVDQSIGGFYDTADYEPRDGVLGLRGRYISAGIYGLSPVALSTLQRCVDRGEHRMRNFQRALVRDGLRLRAHAFSKVLDIDHASDIEKAELFLKG